MEEQLKRSQDERSKLQRKIAGMKREAESSWANERMENAVLRERINDVAAEVARLTATLEGPGSAINSIINGAIAGDPDKPVAALAAQGGTLADRIRALQGRASQHVP